MSIHTLNLHLTAVTLAKYFEAVYPELSPVKPDKAKINEKSAGNSFTGNKNTSPKQKQKALTTLTGENATSRQKEITDELLRAALLNGLDPKHLYSSISQPVSEGSAAQLVGLVSAEIGFAIKVDEDEKILREAGNLQMVAYRANLSQDFRNRFPKVYAVRTEKPYGYIMEKFEGTSFAKMLWPRENDPQLNAMVMDNILSLLFGAYLSSVNANLKPNIRTIYLGRIDERLKSAAEKSSEFKTLTEGGLEINGTYYHAPHEYIRSIENNIDKLGVSFATFVHGDCHPENIIVSVNKDLQPNIRFIDPKDWLEGDYVFDLGKLCHYLLATGPIQKSEKKPTPILDLLKRQISYELDNSGTKTLVEKALAKGRSFAIKHNDASFEIRYLLSMASNLLGLPVMRLKNKERDAALILYAEGIKYLAQCSEALNK
ncbi:hypothetical protein D0C36_15945 [Mucilaginibacter conchicola]|uniref:Aminoglycoside phosphotransferase domain-containing protein n=1 Tax=Mucilaginibacter conchicola TaxID=2303333 RepID=A0A372NUV8_9SPHI|nr:phosphotransferase [Mucilaginibacter conchicola]RFZ92882.1 hypothetical protein D0C36_15945 [Mucilaginibacter conchicola]